VAGKMQRYITKLKEGSDLSSEEAEAAIGLILSTANDDEIGEFLLVLKAKGEKSEEITGFVRGMKKTAYTIKPRVAFRLVDTCGTGGMVLILSMCQQQQQ
jgi:anthranilate phosphoribosyltransferase